MKRLSRKQALYLYRKHKTGDITDRTLFNMLGLDAFCDLVGGWFADFYIDEMMEEIYG